MIIDKALQFSDAQAITASAASTKVIDLKEGGNAYNENWIIATVDTAFSGSGTLAVSVQTDKAEGFSNAVTLLAGSAVAAADLKKGAYALKVKVPQGCERYIRLYYTVTGSLSGGKVTASIAKDVNIQ